jgi:hypothetical protein
MINNQCRRCKEQVENQNLRVPFGCRPLHFECFARGIIGSVAHQQRRCLCYGGNEEDDPTLTTRENAELAYKYFLSTSVLRSLE